MGVRVFKFDCCSTLATLTDSVPGSWNEIDGPDSGCGLDYWYRQSRTGHEAYLNVDQEHLTVSIDGETVWAGDPTEDEVLRKFVSVS